ncbi:NUDIX domain-containing protein [Streptomyces sp. NRRL S-337]|uniref:NUDIX domain-containing protein n=1 Tax=Streptomyces sp. NRRL S-337 TaxID=1463900 RepID=UPI00069238DD|nr:NUDIX domain-containing protein [Streptomyces sp. NRRL S-337]
MTAIDELHFAGGIDSGETPLAAARRELAEETELAPGAVLDRSQTGLLPDEQVDLHSHAWALWSDLNSLPDRSNRRSCWPC